MKRHFGVGLFVGVVSSILVFIIVGVAGAQGSGPQKSKPDQITAEAASPTGGGGGGMLGTTFSYQGLLKKNGIPFTGNCDMQFKLYDAQSGGNLLATITPSPSPVPVVNGLFNTYLNFGDQFRGDYRYLEPLVSCPASGSPSYQSLGLQVIQPAPYALSVRPGATISGTADTALTVISDSPEGTGLIGRADYGGTAWGVAGFSNEGIGVYASGNNNATTPSTALKIVGGKFAVGGNIKPAFIYTVSGVSGNCSSILNPLINNDINAVILVTPRQDTATIPATDVRVIYNTGTWYLCSPSLALNMKYNILVINQ